MKDFIEWLVGLCLAEKILLLISIPFVLMAIYAFVQILFCRNS